MSTTTPTDDARVFYDAMWQSYGHLDAVSPAAFHRRRLVVRLARQAAGRAAEVLDVGCGQGELLRELSAALPRAQVAGADVSAKSLEDSRRRNPTYDLFAIDLTAPGFEAEHAARLGRYDLVVCSEVLEHIEDDRLAARRLALLLKPGGAVIVTVPGGKRSRFDEIIGHHRHYRPEQMAALLEGAGLRVERRLAWGFPFHSIYRTAVRVASRLTMQQPAPGSDPSRRPSRLLGGAYALVGKALHPLFYLNADRCGEQVVVVARKALGAGRWALGAEQSGDRAEAERRQRKSGAADRDAYARLRSDPSAQRLAPSGPSAERRAPSPSRRTDGGARPCPASARCG